MANNNSKEIKRRIPYGVPQIEQYDVSVILRKSDKFEAIINKRIALLKKQGIDVAVCPEYLESIVEEYIASLFNALERKHRKNLNFIKNIFVRRSTDKIEYEKLLADFDVQIASTIEEYNFVERLYGTHNPLYNGRLKLKPFTLDENEDEEVDSDE